MFKICGVSIFVIIKSTRVVLMMKNYSRYVKEVKKKNRLPNVSIVVVI